MTTRLFRVELVPNGGTGAKHPAITLYTEAYTAADAGATVNRSHLRGRRRVVAVTAIADGVGKPGVWATR